MLHLSLSSEISLSPFQCCCSPPKLASFAKSLELAFLCVARYAVLRGQARSLQHVPGARAQLIPSDRAVLWLLHPLRSQPTSNRFHVGPQPPRKTPLQSQKGFVMQSAPFKQRFASCNPSVLWHPQTPRRAGGGSNPPPWGLHGQESGQGRVGNQTPGVTFCRLDVQVQGAPNFSLFL